MLFLLEELSLSLEVLSFDMTLHSERYLSILIYYLSFNFYNLNKPFICLY